MHFPARRLALVVIKRPKDTTHLYLRFGLSKRGDTTFRPIQPSIDLWLLCEPLTPQLIGLIHHFLDSLRR